MAFANGENIMQVVESLVKSVYRKFAGLGTAFESPLPDSPFIRMTYEETMSEHGSDKPDLRIKGLVSWPLSIFKNSS
jgi:aspartyl-tRNA synthetase